jgi:hypothetical protein
MEKRFFVRGSFIHPALFESICYAWVAAVAAVTIARRQFAAWLFERYSS